MEDEMFNNLIESSSHRREFRRRGSFFLFTTASYALLFIIAGVVSIYAYDARMEDQNLELATIMPLVDLPAPETPRDRTPEVERPASGPRSPNLITRRDPTASVEDPELAPIHISSSPNPNPPIPRGSAFKIGDFDADPVQPGDSSPRIGGSGNTGSHPPVIAISEPPPAVVPTPNPVPKVVRKKVLNGDALVLPKPPYPAIAKQMGVQGTVNVQVLIDEKGNVISATAVSGSPFLIHVARQAAYQARFSPTYLGDQPVKVSGVITYNFVLQ
jgi:periplasmic protein TonB